MWLLVLQIILIALVGLGGIQLNSGAPQTLIIVVSVLSIIGEVLLHVFVLRPPSLIPGGRGAEDVVVIMSTNIPAATIFVGSHNGHNGLDRPDRPDRPDRLDRLDRPNGPDSPNNTDDRSYKRYCNHSPRVLYLLRVMMWFCLLVTIILAHVNDPLQWDLMLAIIVSCLLNIVLYILRLYFTETEGSTLRITSETVGLTNSNLNTVDSEYVRMRETGL